MFAANSTSMPTGSLHDMGGRVSGIKINKIPPAFSHSDSVLIFVNTGGQLFDCIFG